MGDPGDADTELARDFRDFSRWTLYVGSRCDAKGKVQVCWQVKLLPAPQLLPESVGFGTTWAG